MVKKSCRSIPSNDFLDHTIEVWQPYYPARTLKREDAREIKHNLVGFFKLLIEWDRVEKAAKDQDPNRDTN